MPAPTAQPTPAAPTGATETNTPKRPKRGAGEGFIKQRRDRDGRPIPDQWRGELMVGYRADGKPDVRYASGKSRAEVRDKLQRLKLQHVSGTLTEPHRMTVAQFLEQWLRDVVRPGLRASTRRNYTTCVAQWVNPVLGGMRLSDVKPQHVQRLLSVLSERTARDKDRPMARTTVLLARAVLRTAFFYAVEMRLIPSNPAGAVRVPGAAGQEIRPYSEEEVRALLGAVRARQGLRYSGVWYALVALALATGARLGELLALTWKDLVRDERHDAGAIRITKSLSTEPYSPPTFQDVKTPASRRTVTIRSEMLAILRAWRREQASVRLALGPAWEAGDLMFTQTTGRAITHHIALDHFKQAARDARIPVARFHDLRHTHATLLLVAGVHVKVVQQRLGHARIATTLDTYGHVVPGLDDRAAQTAEDIVFGPANLPGIPGVTESDAELPPTVPAAFRRRG